MTTSRFPKAVVEELLVKSGRHCCLCNEFKGGKVEVHHIVPKDERGDGTAANAIVLCFDCHGEVHAYWKANPKGKKFTAAELRRHRDQWFKKFSQGGVDEEARARITQVENQLQEIRAELAQTQQGVADIGTEELAKAAGPDTPGLLQEALRLQAENKEREAIDALYAAFRRDLQPAAKAQLHNLLGISFEKLSEYKQADAHYRQALEASRQAGYRRGEAAALNNLGIIYRIQGELGLTEQHQQQSLEIDREIGDRPGEANALGNLGIVYAEMGDLGRADKYLNDSLVIQREIGDRFGEAYCLGNLGIVCAKMGDLKRAEVYFMDSLLIQRELRNRLSEANQLGNLGNLYRQQGHLDRAEEHLRQALGIHREIGNKVGEADQIGNLGLISAQRNQIEEACRLLKEALAIFEEIGASPQVKLTDAALEELGCE